MKKLLFMRHARSASTQSGQTDFERSLTPRGRLEAPMMALALTRHGVRPELIISSPAVRALLTARLVANELSLADHVILLEPVLYEASTDHYLELINGLSEGVQSVLLVGHNPGITEFVNTLAPGEMGEMPQGGLAGVGVDLLRWSEVRGNCGRLLFVEHPVKDRP